MILHGDCLEKLKELPNNSVDSVVTDPPYGLGFMGKEWDTFDRDQLGKKGEEGANDLKVKKNFNILPRYGESKDLYGFSLEWARECLRVLKPGGHLLSFGGSRTYHRMACAIEDAGFEIRDQIMWVYGSGFPKSRNITLDMDKMEGHGNRGHRIAVANRHHPDGTLEPNGELLPAYEPKSENAKRWNGWGTALKPSHEPIVLARKPLSEKTVAENVLKWGTGGINIDGCRVPFQSKDDEMESKKKNQHEDFGTKPMTGNNTYGDYSMVQPKNFNPPARFPANFIHDGSDEVVKLFPDDSQRFFYTAKASKSERNRGLEKLESKSLGSKGNGLGRVCEFCGVSQLKPEMCECEVKSWVNPKRSANHHPTVKPLSLMRYLCKLITPPGGTVLDPFMGSGTTGIAAKLEGFNFIGIEREEEYVKIAEARIQAWEREKEQLALT